ncbi:MAG: preprotein translocase subunit SecE [Candidatus Pacebacteria bacterium]|nr:preprotein translocase subunit SecE [Candidatus Paceibacterota bacterium]
MPNLLQKIKTFFKEVKIEMKKINWPTKQESIRYALIVVGASIVMAIFLGGLDFIFIAILDRFIF